MTRRRRRSTSTSRFGVGRRENHDASGFYERFRPPVLSADEAVRPPFELSLDEALVHGDARAMDLPTGSVALVVTSPPYFAGKAYEEALGQDGVPGSYLDYLAMLHAVFARCVEALEPGGRLAVNVANLGRRPYRSLSADVIRILQDDLGLLLRGEVVWVKAAGASGSCAWGSYRSPTNPVLRDVTERVVIASKGRFGRAQGVDARRAAGLPWRSSLSTDEFLEATLDVWRIPPERASRVGHPAPFPVELPQRLIELYTFEGDLVLDPFLGVGSTAVAAARLGRRFAGYDTDGDYVETARARVRAELATLARPGAGPRAGTSAVAMAEQLLRDSGFSIRHRRHPVPALGLSIDLVAEDGAGDTWYFDVSGSVTVADAGLASSDALWRCLGRAAVLASQTAAPPLVVLTTQLPPRRSAGDKALRAAGPAAVFDAVELASPEDADRLALYAKGSHRDRPAPGFWPAP
ncbi:MAG TPA: site-specific DNA-methyltransferase [Acidimicrobiales bacterium]|nr:site-specific DNA-methyltransferase [Acidimicrobiales bacterium]